MSICEELVSTPFSDKLLNIKKLNITSFHALPINQLKGLSDSTLKEKYLKLLGETYPDSEITYTGNLMDTPVLPKSILKESQQLTSVAFGSKETFYVTTGTTTSNYISILSCVACGDKVLADRNSHQSIHFALSINKNNVEYSENIITEKASGRNIMNVSNFIEKYKVATEEGEPYKLVILNGCSYEGVIYNVYSIMEKCLKINPDVIFLVDEAWMAYGYFHHFYKKYTAMYSAKKLSKKYPNLKVIATQSAHKSLSCMRQASYIHAYGPKYFINEIWKYKYMLHTTSPNYPILATLELARAQMVLEGNELISETLEFSYKIISEIKKCKTIHVNELDNTKWYICDPCKISVNFAEKNTSINEIVEVLLKNGIYINRKTSNSILFNIHIGITKKDIHSLIRILKKIDHIKFKKNDKTTCAEHYVIAYPPGTPIFLPGDKVDESECERVKFIKKTGASIIKI